MVPQLRSMQLQSLQVVDIPIEIPAPTEMIEPPGRWGVGVVRYGVFIIPHWFSLVVTIEHVIHVLDFGHRLLIGTD